VVESTPASVAANEIESTCERGVMREVEDAALWISAFNTLGDEILPLPIQS
jgi:hypothetical protein